MLLRFIKNIGIVFIAVFSLSFFFSIAYSQINLSTILYLAGLIAIIGAILAEINRDLTIPLFDIVLFSLLASFAVIGIYDFYIGGWVMSETNLLGTFITSLWIAGVVFLENFIIWLLIKGMW